MGIILPPLGIDRTNGIMYSSILHGYSITSIAIHNKSNVKFVKIVLLIPMRNLRGPLITVSVSNHQGIRLLYKSSRQIEIICANNIMKLRGIYYVECGGFHEDVEDFNRISRNSRQYCRISENTERFDVDVKIFQRTRYISKWCQGILRGFLEL